MLRVLIILLIFLGAFAAALLPAYALEVRTGRHEDFSRLVFDWGKPVEYTVSQEAPGKIVIRFKDNGVMDPGVLKAGVLENIKGAAIVSSSPLEIAVDVPPGSKTRDFQAAGRIMIDVYDAPGTPPGKKPPPAAPAPAKQAKKPDVKRPKEKAKEETAKILQPAPPAVKAEVAPVAAAGLSPPTPDHTAPEVVDNPGSSAPDEEELKSQGAAASGPIVSNLITISSIDASGLAVFSRDDKIWLVSDKDDIMLLPQVSGPDAQKLSPMETADIPGGKIFKLPTLPEAFIKGQGGGLLWRILVPAKPNKNPPVSPERFSDDEKAVRSGSIIWRFEGARRVLETRDPVTGNKMYVVTVAGARDYSGPAQRFVDFETLESAVGLAIVSKVDDLEVSLTPKGILEITRPGGLVFTSEKKLKAMQQAHVKKVAPGVQADAKRIFDFKNWQIGGIEALDENRNVILNQIADKDGSEKVEGILTLAKMYLSNGLWAEAKGFLELARDGLPELNQNPGFTALLGAALALGWESEEAFNLLSAPELGAYPEIGYWRAYALADLGDWQQADEVFPDGLYILSDYPPAIRTKLSLVLAEVALRAGDTAKGEELLGFAGDSTEDIRPQQLAALNYLKGEAARQKNKIEDTKKFWKALTTGEDDLYRAKAGLALTRLLVDKKELKNDKAIDNLERLRYAWRGDELEAQIAYWLGKAYFETAQYVKGLVIMREAASYAADTDIGRRITNEMMQVFVKLFTGPDLDKIPAVDAAALYEQFASLIPSGPESDKISERLAERLVKADLLDRASEILQGQVEHLDPANSYRVTVRLAAINLLDDQPARALEALSKAQGLYGNLPKELQTPDKILELALLRARALSGQDKSDQALALLKDLPRNPDANKLRADIAWHAGYWDDAAEALNDVVLDRDISLTRPLDAGNAALILQRAVALNLASDRVGLAGMREQYSDAMAQTDKAKIFEVVTRARQSSALADRATLMGVVSEVDLFKDFLAGYKAEPAPQASAAPATPPPAK